MMATPDTYLSHWLAHRGNIWNDEQTSLDLGLFTRKQTVYVCD